MLLYVFLHNSITYQWKSVQILHRYMHENLFSNLFIDVIFAHQIMRFDVSSSHYKRASENAAELLTNLLGKA